MNKEIIPYEGKRPYVFVSYSHSGNDNNTVLETIDILQRKFNYRIWFDNGIHSGENWSQKIVQHLEACSTFVVFLSPNSLNSRNVGSEISLAFSNNKIKIIPIWITPPCEMPGDIKYYLSFTQHAFEKNPGTHTPEELADELNIAIPDSLRDASQIVDDVLVNTEEDLHDLILDNSIKKIADAACKERLKLNYIQFPKSLVEIGHEAFRGCSALTEVFIPRNIKKIGDSAFRDCVSLQKLVIEEEIEIGERAFENCRSLTDITLPPDMREIYSGVFNSCRSLTKISLPASIVAIGDNAFAFCDKLKEVRFPKNVSRIDDAVFAGCSSLSKVVFTESVSKIGKNVFKDCDSLTSISLPASLHKMDSGCFRGCTSLQEINVNAKNKHYKSMDGIMFNKNKSVLICYPSMIGNENYEIPDSVCQIEDWAFSDAIHLKNVTIPDSVESIGEGAFFRCESLEKIVIPYSVDSINDTAFRGCKNLKEAYIESKSVKDWGWGIFYGCSPDLTVYYCSDVVKEYCESLGIKHKRFSPKNLEV